MFPAVADGTRTRRYGGYVIALVAGVPVAALSILGSMFRVLNGDPFPVLFALVAAGVPTVGSILAVVGMASRPQRFRKTALWLTVPVAILFWTAAVLFVLWIMFLIAVIGSWEF